MVALVTGGSRGIGLAVVKALLEKDFTVVAAARSESDALRELKKTYGGRLLFYAADIALPEARAGLAAFIKETFGSLNLLVNNAGVAPRVRKDILELTPEDMDAVLNVNLKGTFFMSQAMAPLLVAGAPARIVNISSVSAYAASVNRGEYCISKAGISMTTKLFAARLAKEGVAVLEVRPGIIATDMTAGVREKYEAMIAEGLLPVPRMGTPEDVAACVAAAAAGQLDYCTGMGFDCDGGFGVRRL